MSVSSLASDDLTIEKPNGETIGPFRGQVSSGSKILIMDEDAPLEDGDVVSRELPSGAVERFIVESADFIRTPSASGIPSFWQLEVRKEDRPAKQPSASQVINVGGESNVQIGDHNTQNVRMAVQQLVSALESSGGSEREKAEAKSLLRSFLEHPLLAATVGAAGSLLG